mgnify:CR=1 FL=1
MLEAGPGARATPSLRLKACLERGEFVSILGDRIGGGARARVARRSLLGAPAPSQGPFLPAHALGCPIVLLIALRAGRTATRCFAEPLADQVVLPRPERPSGCPRSPRRYAERLEAYCPGRAVPVVQLLRLLGR